MGRLDAMARNFWLTRSLFRIVVVFDACYRSKYMCSRARLRNIKASDIAALALFDVDCMYPFGKLVDIRAVPMVIGHSGISGHCVEESTYPV